MAQFVAGGQLRSSRSASVCSKPQFGDRSAPGIRYARMTAVAIPEDPPIRLGGLTHLLARMPALLPDRWLVLGMSDAARERVIGRCGPLEIRQRESGLLAQTRVKGEQEQALATAAQRFRQFLCRNYRSGLDARLQRPLLQSEDAPGRWTVRMRLTGAAQGIVSPASRGGRVRTNPVPAETVVVLPIAGRPTIRAMEQGAETVHKLLETTPWLVTGDPAVRLDAPISRLPLLAHFNLEIPISDCGSDLACDRRSSSAGVSV